MENNVDSNNFQIYEISKFKWVDIKHAETYFRDYNIEKKKIIFDLKKLLKIYKLYM